MAVDIFATRTMLAALREMRRPKTGILSLFFTRESPTPSKFIDIDIYKGKRRLAPFVAPRNEGRVMQSQGYTTRSFDPAYVKPKMPTEAQEMLDRSMGDTIYQEMTPQQRAQQKLGMDLADLDDQITRREEWMAAQALQTGEIPVVGDGVDRVVDIHMDANHIVTLSGTDLWTDSAADPLAKLDSFGRTISQDSGLQADIVVMGADAWDNFIAHSNVQNKLDTRRIDEGLIDLTNLPDGLTYRGNLRGRDIYTYDEWYYDESAGSEAPMLDTDKIIMGSSRARASVHNALIEDMAAIESNRFAVARYPKSWVENDPGIRWLMMQSAPLPVPHQVDGFLTATVI